MPANPAEGGIFRSQAWLDLEAKRQAITDAEAAVVAANATLADHRAEAERLEQIEEERLYSIREKEMISRRQAARNRVSTIAKLATQLELDMAALATTYAALKDEADALDAVLPDTVACPFTREALDELFEIETYRAGLPAPIHTRPEPISLAVETLGKQAVEEMSDALGIRPRKAREEAAEEAA